MADGEADAGTLQLGLLRAASWGVAAIPNGFGQGKVARVIYKRAMQGQSPGYAVARYRGARLKLDLGEHIQALAFLMRDYDPGLLRFIESRLRRGGVFLDVG